MPDFSPTDYAIPGFVLLVVVEMIWARRMRRDAYEPRDTLTSLVFGLGSTVAGVFSAGLVFAAFLWVWQFRLFGLPPGFPVPLGSLGAFLRPPPRLRFLVPPPSARYAKALVFILCLPFCRNRSVTFTEQSVITTHTYCILAFTGCIIPAKIECIPQLPPGLPYRNIF